MGSSAAGTMSTSGTSTPSARTQSVNTKGFDDSPIECPSQRPELLATIGSRLRT